MSRRRRGGRFIRNRGVTFLGTLATRSPRSGFWEREIVGRGGGFSGLNAIKVVIRCRRRFLRAMTSTRSFVIARRRHGGCTIYFRFPPLAPFVSCRPFSSSRAHPPRRFNFTRELPRLPSTFNFETKDVVVVYVVILSISNEFIDL